MSINPAIETLLVMLDQCFDRKAWHGPHLKASIRGVDAAEAVWRPQPGRRNIAEQVLHAAYWKYVVRRKLCGDKRGSFPLKGSNWFAVRRRPTAAEWDGFVAILDDQHKLLRRSVVDSGSRRRGRLADADLRRISGIAAHDVYHAGQIRLIRTIYDASRGKRC